MAINENDREDLLRDAKMMPIRGETQIDENMIVIGFRSDGQLSLYCDADPVFQFNAEKELRRVYYNGVRYAAEQGVLVELTRNSQGGKVAFNRQAVSAEIASEIMQVLTTLLSKIAQSAMAVWKTAGDETEFTARVQRWMHEKDLFHVIADSPNVS